jgi:branched-chain amino acid transport system permease protein
VLPEFLRSIGDLRLIVYGASVTLVVLFMPGGIAEAARLLRSQLLPESGRR